METWSTTVRLLYRFTKLSAFKITVCMGYDGQGITDSLYRQKGLMDYRFFDSAVVIWIVRMYKFKDERYQSTIRRSVQIRNY